jgi:NadR type nicotinamide-nucleotide adenylyltransferase
MIKRGLVVGKFCPLHKGHELLINRALDMCERVTIISYTNPEFPECAPAVRERWLRALFPRAEVLVLDSEKEDVPPNDASDDVHRQFVAKLCIERLGHLVDAVFTSEAYGDGFARVLAKTFDHHVAHISVDRARSIVLVSGTAVRANPYRHRAFLSPVVYSHFVKRVCLLGGESTGKTTTAAKLAERLETLWVPEFGRTMWNTRKGKLLYVDMLAIARAQVELETAAIMEANRWLVCDTTPLTTLFYSRHLFGMADAELLQLADRPYDQYFMCAADFPLVQDGTRQDEAFREHQQQWYSYELARRDVNAQLLRGTLEDRLQLARSIIAPASGRAISPLAS